MKEIPDSEQRMYPVPKPNLMQEIADMLLRGLKLVEDLQEAEGGAWSGVELRKRFGLSLADLRRRRKEQRIIHWQGRQRTICYPQWQFTPTGGLLPGVEELLQIFHSNDQWRVMRYFLSPRNQLDGHRPLDLLRAGKVKKVLAHAHSHAEDNTW